MATGSTVAATVAATVNAALNALSSTLYPEFAEITWSVATAKIIGTAKTAGVPTIVTFAVFESDGTTPDTDATINGAASSTGTVVTAATGPTFWDNANNWDTGAIPVNGDTVYFMDSNKPCTDGLEQSAVTVTNLNIMQSYTGTIGRPRNNPGGYVEYRATSLALSATNTFIGQGQGSGSGRIRIDFGATASTVLVTNTGSPAENGVKSVLLIGTGNNVITVDKGSVALGHYNEASTNTALNVGFVSSVNSDADVRMGTNCTLSGTITKTGGNLELNTNFGTLNQYGGTTTINLSATATAMNIYGGTCIDNSTGTKTAVIVAGEVTKAQSIAAATYTATTVRKSGILRDPGKKITFTGAIALTCSISECTLDLGNTLSLQRS